VAQVVKEAIVHPWMGQEEWEGYPLPPDQRHHPTRIGQLEKREVLAAPVVKLGAQGGPHPSVGMLEGRMVMKGVQGGPHPSRGMPEGRVVKKGVQEGPHPSVEPLGDQEGLQAAQVGLRGDRAVKQEGPVESQY